MSVNEMTDLCAAMSRADLPGGCEPRERRCQFVLALGEAREVKLPLGIGLRELVAGPSECEGHAGKWETGRIVY